MTYIATQEDTLKISNYDNIYKSNSVCDEFLYLGVLWAVHLWKPWSKIYHSSFSISTLSLESALPC